MERIDSELGRGAAEMCKGVTAGSGTGLCVEEKRKYIIHLFRADHEVGEGRMEYVGVLQPRHSKMQVLSIAGVAVNQLLSSITDAKLPIDASVLHRLVASQLRNGVP